MANKKFTWANLKEFANSLPEEELQKEVIWWGDECGGQIDGAHQLEEDYVTTDYGCEPASAQEYDEGDDPYEVTHPKGTPILQTDMPDTDSEPQSNTNEH
jgi:hypothetical protein